MAMITDSLIGMMHTDPEEMDRVPTNTQIIDANPDLKKSGITDLTAGERQGFLEMWRIGAITETIGALADAELAEVVEDYDSRADTFRDTDKAFFELRRDAEVVEDYGSKADEHRGINEMFFDLRFVATAARNRLNLRTKQSAPMFSNSITNKSN